MGAVPICKKPLASEKKQLARKKFVLTWKIAQCERTSIKECRTDLYTDKLSRDLLYFLEINFFLISLLAAENGKRSPPEIIQRNTAPGDPPINGAGQ